MALLTDIFSSKTFSYFIATIFMGLLTYILPSEISTYCTATIFIPLSTHIAPSKGSIIFSVCIAPLLTYLVVTRIIK